METFDYLVIGGGSGGLASARRAAAHGAKVGLIEGGRLGGTCVNVGCVPKKVMWNAASIAETIHDAKYYGFDIGEYSFDWPTLKARRDAYIVRLNDIYKRNLEKSHVTEIRGWAHFEDAHTVSVNGQHYRGEKILIATGGKPALPGIPGEEHGITSDGFFALETMPQRVAVVGAGYIAVELAGVLNSLGAKVSLMLRQDLPLRTFDTMLSIRLLDELRAAGIQVYDHTTATEVVRYDDGTLVVHTEDCPIDDLFDCLIWAIGRKPNVQHLRLDAAGVQLTATGQIQVDTFEATTVPHIYSLGDVTGPVELTPVAIAAGRKLADRLFADESNPFDYRNVPSVIFSHPPIGSVGLSEAQAIQEHGEDQVHCYTPRFTNMYYAFHEQKSSTEMKVVTVGTERKVVGIHAIGLGVDEMIQGFAVALNMGATLADLKRTIAIHPTASEELVLIG